MPISRQVAIMRIAISPRLAIKTFLNILDYLTVLQFVGTRGGVVRCGGLVLVQRGFSIPQGGQAQGPRTSSSPPIVPTKSNWVGVSLKMPAGLPDLLRSPAAWRWSQPYNGARVSR